MNDQEQLIQDLQSQLNELVEVNSKLVRENKRIQDEWARDRAEYICSASQKQLGTSFEQPLNSIRIFDWRKRAIELEFSYQFRFGKILLDAMMKPGRKTLNAPILLAVLVKDMVTGEGRVKAQRALSQNL